MNDATLTLCPSCDADRFPAEYRGAGGPSHYTAHDPERWMMIPYLDGVRLERCEECLIGADGWAVVLPETAQWCQRCGWDALREVRRGTVAIEDPTAPPARSETASGRRVRELADDIELVLVPRILALTGAARRAGDRERLKRIQTSLVTRIGKETAGE